MLTEKDWDSVYFSVMPLASVALGITGIALSVFSLVGASRRSVGTGSRESQGGAQPLSVPIPKVHYQDGRVLVQVRSPGEWVDIRDFVRPLDPRVQEIYRRVGPNFVGLVDWVCENINYTSDDGEWWKFPGETIRWKSGDCDDSAILTCSLLLNMTDCYVAVGTYKGLGHAWGVTDHQILESTYTEARAVPDPQNYRTYALFNNREVIELWPGAMTYLFQLSRNERQKLTLMARAVRGAA